MSEALRGLSDWITSTTPIDLGGNSGNGGNKPEKLGFSRYHQTSPDGSGNGDAGCVTTVTTQEIRVVTDKPPKSRDVTTVTTVTTENDDLAWLSRSAHTAYIASPDGTVEVRYRQPDGQWSSSHIERPPSPRRAAERSSRSHNVKGGAKPEPPDEPDEWGLSRYTIRDLANWYEEEANRRVGLETRSACPRPRPVPSGASSRSLLRSSSSASCRLCLPSRQQGPLEAHNVKAELKDRIP